MAGKREKPEEIVSKLRQVEVLQGQGATIAEADAFRIALRCNGRGSHADYRTRPYRNGKHGR